MKKRLLASLCVLMLALSGCASMLNREYTSSSAHPEYPVGKAPPVLQAENYQGLVNAILYFVTEHEETGLIHLSSYAGNTQTGLDAACAEVRLEDPLAAYAVEEISHSTSNYEVTISIRYAHTAEEVAAIVPAAGSSAIRQTISVAMAGFAERCVLRINYFTGDESSLEQLAWQTWLDTPLTALAEPEIHVALYPNSGTSRIAEVELLWPEELPLAERSSALEQHALALLEGLSNPPGERTLEELLDALSFAADYHPQSGGTAYDVLVDGSGNDRGFALTLRLLCQLADLEATVAEGSLSGAPHYWLIVSTPEGYRHLDPTTRTAVYATDDQFLAEGYAWDAGRYPACTDYAASGQTDEENPDGATEENTNGEPGADGGISGDPMLERET